MTTIRPIHGHLVNIHFSLPHVFMLPSLQFSSPPSWPILQIRKLKLTQSGEVIYSDLLSHWEVS